MSSLSSILRPTTAVMATLSPPRHPPPSSRNLSSLSHITPTMLAATRRHHRRHTHDGTLTVRSIDAAQPYDYETKLARINNSYPKLKIAVVGFGNFGQFLAKTLVSQGHNVIAHSRSDYSKIAAKLGVSFFRNPDDLCEEHPEVILLCTSILSTEPVLKSLPLQRLKRSTLFVDVLSVKEFPRSLFLQHLPPDFDILCTHPMFGPESGKFSWKGLPFVYDKVRIGVAKSRVQRCESFLDVFRREGCKVSEMSCAEHDKHAAGSQFITHYVGRVLEQLELEDTPINTKGYESLLNLVENTSKDSFELFYGLFMFNKNALEQVRRLDAAFEIVKGELFERLHEKFRAQQFGGLQQDNVEVVGRVVEKKEEMKLLSDGSQNGST